MTTGNTEDTESAVVGNADIDTIAAAVTPQKLTLESGFEIKVNRLKTLETMSLLKILTAGASSVIGSISFDADAPTEKFVGQLIGAMLIAIPEAKTETISFIKEMVRPAALIEGKHLSEPEQEINAELMERLDDELDNPELEDLFTVVSQIIEVEGPHIQSLGKRLALLFSVQQKSETAKQKNSSSARSRR